MLRDSYVTVRAGKLDRTITIERATITPDENGTPVQTWATLATVKAEMLEMGSQDFMRTYGASFEAVGIFRIRWMDGLTLADRVLYNGKHYLMEDIKEIGRRVGLELRCKAVGPS